MWYWHPRKVKWHGGIWCLDEEDLLKNSTKLFCRGDWCVKEPCHYYKLELVTPLLNSVHNVVCMTKINIYTKIVPNTWHYNSSIVLDKCKCFYLFIAIKYCYIERHRANGDSKMLFKFRLKSSPKIPLQGKWRPSVLTEINKMLKLIVHQTKAIIKLGVGGKGQGPGQYSRSGCESGVPTVANRTFIGSKCFHYYWFSLTTVN